MTTTRLAGVWDNNAMTTEDSTDPLTPDTRHEIFFVT